MKQVDELKSMLEAFYNGTATKQEEETLRQALTGKECPAELQAERKLFIAWQQTFQTTDAEPPAGLEERLAAAIDRRASRPVHAHSGYNRRRVWLWSGGIAASILLCLSIGLHSLSGPTESEPKGSLTDPEQAYAFLEATLKEMSASLNQGIAQARTFEQEIQATHQEINQLLSNKTQQQ